MKDSGGNKRVILIKGSKAQWYEQAIFIVKKNVPRSKVPIDFVEEAERIVESYITVGHPFAGQAVSNAGRPNYTLTDSSGKGMGKIKPHKVKKDFLNSVVTVAMLGGCIVLAAYLLVSFL